MSEDLELQCDIDQFAAAVAEAQAKDFKIPVELDAFSAFALIGTMQLALKHPEFAHGPTANHIAGIALELQNRLPATLRRLSQKGWPEGRCRVCGCTDERACEDPHTGGPCSWVEPNLCSACAGREAT